ncbi:MAG: FtsX-like permease family protein [Roseburia sp.]|nr:FtsX-like permease family protein [Roseburia sp.]MCM1241903.1 FtsX-like permease family protein [Roseburia sp.]
MSSGMIKTTIREIKESLGRFVAIMAIVMLGVALFAGLKITKPAMIATGNTYLAEQNFYDFRLLSTIGFEEEDVQKFSELKEIAEAEGSISIDALCAIEDGNESVYKIQAMPEKINQLVLTQGRTPEAADECVLDASLFADDIIGSRITVTDNNNEDTLDMLKEKTFTVVGIVQSPCYINFERGTTSIGDGKVSGFFCVPKEAFDCDYLTEIYLTVEQQYDIYTDEYDDYIESLEDGLEDETEAVVAARYTRLIAEAQEKIDDAQTELDDKTKEAEEELDDAWQKITDGEQEIADGEKEIADGEQEIIDGEAEIADHEKEIADGRTQIQQAIESLDAQEAELTAQETQLSVMQAMMPAEQYQGMLLQIQQGKAQIEAARTQIASQEAELSSGEQELANARTELEEARTELEDAKAEIADAKIDIEEAKTEYEDAKAEFEEEVADAQRKIDDAQEELAEIEEPDEYVLTRNANIGYACFDSDTDVVAAIADLFPVFFFLVAALVCMTTMNRMVEEQRTQIGVLKALGYGNGAIMGKYLFYAGSAAAVGAIAGYALGIWLFPKTIWAGYAIMYNMDGIHFLFDGWLAFFSLAAALLCSMGTAYFSCRYELYSVPANLIRPKAPKSGKRIFLENITFIWRRMKFLHKVSMRNIIRYKKRFFMMILGISGCTALLVAAFGIRSSVMNIAEMQYDEIQIFDIGVAFSDSMQKEDMEILQEEIPDIERIACRYEETVDLDFGGKTKSLYLEIPEDVETFTTFVNLHTKDGETIPYPAEGEAVLSAKAAENMGIKTGDTVTVRDNDMNTLTVKISGICENFVYNYIYINKETYRNQLNVAPEYKSAYAIVKEDVDVHETAAAVADRNDVLSVTVIQDMRVRISNMMQSMDYIVALIIVCAGSLAFIVLYNLTNINITERLREIATIKVLGFYAKETADYVFRENMALTGMGALAGLFFGKWLHWFIMYNINIDMVSFKTTTTPLSYVLSFIGTFIFALFVDGIMFFKLDKINMAESLKSME